MMRFAKLFSLVLPLLFAALGHSQSGEVQRRVMQAFEHSTTVALPHRHQDSNSSRFRIELISQPQFAITVNDIVIE